MMIRNIFGKKWGGGGFWVMRLKKFFDQGLTLPEQALIFTCLQYNSFENTVGKGEIARNEQFLLFPLCFLHVFRTFCPFISSEIVVCKLFQFGRVQNFVVWEKVKPFDF